MTRNEYLDYIFLSQTEALEGTDTDTYQQEATILLKWVYHLRGNRKLPASSKAWASFHVKTEYLFEHRDSNYNKK